MIQKIASKLSDGSKFRIIKASSYKILNPDSMEDKAEISANYFEFWGYEKKNWDKRSIAVTFLSFFIFVEVITMRIGSELVSGAI